MASIGSDLLRKTLSEEQWQALCAFYQKWPDPRKRAIWDDLSRVNVEGADHLYNAIAQLMEPWKVLGTSSNDILIGKVGTSHYDQVKVVGQTPDRVQLANTIVDALNRHERRQR